MRATNRLANLYEQAGRWAESADLRRASLGPRRETTPPDSPELAAHLTNLGLDLVEQEKGAEADPLLRESLKISETKRPDEWMTFHTRSLLGACLLSSKEFAAAEPLIVNGYEGMKARESKIPASESFIVPKAAERVVRLYDRWGKPDQAARWRGILRDGPPKSP